MDYIPMEAWLTSPRLIGHCYGMTCSSSDKKFNTGDMQENMKTCPLQYGIYLWDHHQRAKTEVIFLEVIQGEIVEGEKFNQRLMNMMAKGLGQRRDFMEWVTEAGELFSKVHCSIEALKVWLKMAESGLVEKYPDALHPYHH